MTSSFRRDLVAHIPDMRAYACFLTRNSDAADDLVQDVIIRALQAEEQYTPGNFRGWLFTILHNSHTSNMRRRRFCAVSFDPATSEACATPAEQDVGLSLDDFLRAFETLPDAHREALLLIGAKGLTYEDAARICDCPMGTIKSRLSRARREITKALEGDALPRRAKGPLRRVLSPARFIAIRDRKETGKEGAAEEPARIPA